MTIKQLLVTHRSFMREFERAVVRRRHNIKRVMANQLKAQLAKNGIAVIGKVQGKSGDIAPEKRNFITAYKSPTLANIIHDTNQRSDNALGCIIISRARIDR